MLSGFQTGKNKKITISDNDKVKEFVSKLEVFDEAINEDLQSISEEDDDQFQLSIDKQFYHPSTVGAQNYKISRESPKKQSFETVVGTKSIKRENEISTDLMLTIQKQYDNKHPIYEMNKLLLFKVRKLPQLSARLVYLKQQMLIGIQIRRSSFQRTASTKGYFKHNYANDGDLSEWIKHHSGLIGWKQQSKGRFINLEELIQELEYRYFIEYVQQIRTLVQRMCSRDENLAGHYILLVVDIEYQNNKTIIELSDGWYSLFFVTDSNPIYKKLKIGNKLHLANLFEYPIQFDYSKSKLISAYKYQYLIITTHLNSIKRASKEDKLGKQQMPYFLRSIKSLKQGIIPCLDVFILDKSYLSHSNDKSHRTAIRTSNAMNDGQLYTYFIQVCDSLHYFENSNIKNIITIQVCKSTVDQYEQIHRGCRVRIINSNQQDTSIKVINDRNSGVLIDCLKQYQFITPAHINHEKHEVTLVVEQYIHRKYRNIIVGGAIKVEVWNDYFNEVIDDSIINKEIIIKQCILDYIPHKNDLQIQMKQQFLKQPSLSIDRPHKLSTPNMMLQSDHKELRLNKPKRELSSVSYMGADERKLRVLALPNPTRRSVRQTSKLQSSEEASPLINNNKKVFRQGLQKIYEETFVRNLIDRSYVHKINHLNNYQTQILDDLQFGKDQEVDETDNAFYNFISKYLDMLNVIHPQSQFKSAWNIILLITYFLIFIWLPYKLSFELNYMEQLIAGEQYKNLVIEPVIIAVLILDVLFSCNEAYISKGMIVSQRYHIMKHYIRSLAASDFICLGAMIYQLILVHEQESEFEQDYMQMQLFFCVAFGILKSYRINIILLDLQEFFSIRGIFKEIFRLLKIFLFILYIIHLSACIWYGLGAQQQSNDTWVDLNNLRHASNGLKYTYALHWASVYLTSVGQTTLYPNNIQELTFAAFISFVSLIIMGIVVVSIGLFLYKLQQGNLQKYAVNTMNNYMSMNKIDFNLQVRIRNYLDYICKEEQSMIDEDVSKIICKLSSRLQNELRYQLRCTILDQCTIVSQNFSKKLQKLLVNYMEEVTTTPEEHIIRVQEVDDSSIYVINKGEVEVVFEGTSIIGEKVKKNVIKNLQKGEYFGFYGFITGKPRTASVISKGFCRVFRIKRAHFLNLLEQFPNDKEIFLMLKDQVMLYSDYNGVDVRCYGCKSSRHLANECGILHFVADNDKVIKRDLFPMQQDRDDTLIPRKTKFMNALLSQKIISQIARDIQQDMEEVTATGVVVQDQDMMSDTDTRTYSQMQSRSISRSLSQFSRVSQMPQSQHQPQQSNQIQHQQLKQEAEFDQVMDKRQVFSRKQDQKNTMETAGFGKSKQFGQADVQNEVIIEDSQLSSSVLQSEGYEEEEEEIYSSSSSDQERKKQLDQMKQQQHSSNSSAKSNNIRGYQNQKVTFQGNNIDQQQQYVQRNSIKRKSTKTTNTAVVFDNVLAQLQDASGGVLTFPLITLPSLGEFDKLCEFRIYFPWHNLSRVLKITKKYQNKEVQQLTSQYSFFIQVIQKGIAIRNTISKNAIFIKKIQQVQAPPKLVKKPTLRNLMF